MSADWIKSPTARKVLVHWADARPAWLWSQDGEQLLWRNDAARFFHGKIRRHEPELAPDVVPIRGQVARLLRMGTVGQASLSRIQFLSGERPLSTTCICTPLELADGTLALLIVGVDAIEPELLETLDPGQPDTLSTSLFPPGSEFLVISDDSQITAGSRLALDRYAPTIESEGLPPLPDEQGAEVEIAGEPVTLTRFTASPQDAMLLLFEKVPGSSHDGVTGGMDEIRAEEGIDPELEHEPVTPPPAEPLLPLGLPEVPAASAAESAANPDEWIEGIPQAPLPIDGTLASLFDRLAGDEGLYAALSVQDETFSGPPPELPESVFVEARPELPDLDAEALTEAVTEQEAVVPPADGIAEIIDAATAEEPSAPTTVTWRIVGRGFEAAVASDSAGQGPAAGAAAESAEEVPATLADAPDPETVERVSRYNFEELGRILNDRVSNPASPTPAPEPSPSQVPAPSEGALISVAGETFILNRLPLGIMVFRDQQVLFANRSLTDLMGYDSVEQLRAAGLSAIFPVDSASVGPVTQLTRSDGTLTPVTAKLQSISWHGKPALMLSASPAQPQVAHEAAVKAFAELHANLVDEGFVTADRAGVVTSISLRGRILLGHAESELAGKPLAALVDAAGIPDLKRFLDRPARFAETARPSVVLEGREPGTQVVLMAEGQAGITTGYFGFVRRHGNLPAAGEPATPPRGDDVEPSMLVRISRGVRGPLNSIIGFADIVRMANPGSAESQRAPEYARDIKAAGEEIATLIDELDDYTRLREGRYPVQPGDIELYGLLDTCLMRVKAQAAEARVLVRSAVSERLPHITADRASLTQAILNLLASAIDQTPPGGTVILSAQHADDGAVVVNVRDSGERRTDMGERFVVFRDGVGKDGEVLAPVRSSVGLALTRSLLAVNALSLNVDPTAGVGMMFSLAIPSDLVRAG